jgi:hypothetical protein
MEIVTLLVLLQTSSHYMICPGIRIQCGVLPVVVYGAWPIFVQEGKDGRAACGIEHEKYA